MMYGHVARTLLLLACGVSVLPAQQAAPVASSVKTPAELRMAAAASQLQTKPDTLAALNDLANAEIARARETADPKYLVDASVPLRHALSLAPDDFQSGKTQVALLLAQKQYERAKQQATALHQRVPDDVMVFGYLAEAEIALGQYDDAEKNAQWMLNMRPNNTPGLLLGARLRAHYGDPDGALSFLKLAYAETSPTAVEELAWIANQMADVEIDAGHPAAALPMLQRAEQLFPGYPYTRQNLLRLHDVNGTAATTAQAPAGGDALLPAAAATSSHALVAKPVGTVLTLPVLAFAPIPQALLVPLPTSTERTLHTAQVSVSHSPKDARAYASLGAAYVQRARETGDVSDYELAEKALNLSLSLDAASFSAEVPLESLAEVCMGEHRFADALAYSQRALSLGSGDLSPFALVGDADADMGEYDKAGLAYARLDASGGEPSSHAAYARDSRMAYLHFVAGETAEAIRMMKVALSEGIEARLPQENLAWLYYELGEFEVQGGDALAANAAYLMALQTHPGDYRALAGMAKLRANHGRYEEAVGLYQRAIAVVPMPIFVGELGDLYARLGNKADAQKQYQLVEYIGMLGKINQVLHNRDLALFYADHDTKLPEALALAQKEFEVRHDIYTWDALSWALYKNGKLAEASQASEKALAHGTRDALLLFHAGMIAASAGEAARAQQMLSEALSINPQFQLVDAPLAQKTLAALKTQVASGSSTGPHAR